MGPSHPGHQAHREIATRPTSRGDHSEGHGPQAEGLRGEVDPQALIRRTPPGTERATAGESVRIAGFRLASTVYQLRPWGCPIDLLLRRSYHRGVTEAVADRVRYEEKMSNFRDGMDVMFDRIGNSIRSWKNIIRWTKRVVGLIVTSGLLVGTYFIVSFIGRGILWLVENWNWDIVIGIGALAAIIGVLIGLFYLMKAWVFYIAEHGLKLWYAKLIYYPLYFLVYWPLKILFFHFFWQLLCVNGWYFIVKGARLVWGSILGFLGIFGEYFGASYTDYCPGIDWDENK